MSKTILAGDQKNNEAINGIIRPVHKFIIHAVQAFQRLFICIQST